MQESPGKSSEPVEFGGFIDQLLASQQQLTVVERFAQRHENLTSPSLESHYRDLIPVDALVEGEQYAFEVDLDSCSGCKACVAACHSLNGLEEGELWRNTGMLIGGSETLPVLQHVTVACHHCLDPACMKGCPVNAYEKDPITGIVAHLDDQCIGCKYCMFMCPYDVPSYSADKGIVRKCNMCADRLTAGEAPACVQSCPNKAIRITKVGRDEIIDSCENDQLVPGAPDVHLTMPTTRYNTERVLPRNLLPDDYYIAKPLHAHFPLVFMLVLTQMAFGIFSIGFLIQSRWSTFSDDLLLRMNLIGLTALLGGLAVAVLHLGRPDKAYRAMAGLRTSWLSREIAGFNLFVGVALGLVAYGFFPAFFDSIGISRAWLAGLTVIAGGIAVACSVMLYVVTKRPLWSAFRTTSLFSMTALILGTAVAMSAICYLGSSEVESSADTFREIYVFLLKLLMISVLVKLTIEASVFTHLKSYLFTPYRHAANLMIGDMQWPTMMRFVLGAVGGVVLPLLLVAEISFASRSGFPGSMVTLTTVSVLLLIAAELIERYLFFAVSVARRMPGAPN